VVLYPYRHAVIFLLVRPHFDQNKGLFFLQNLNPRIISFLGDRGSTFFKNMIINIRQIILF